VRVALAQLSASPDRDSNLARVFEAMKAAHEARADLIAFPEVILDRFFPQHPGDKTALALAEPIPGPSADLIAALARELGLVTVFNLYELGKDGKRYDSSPVFDADGTLLGITRMIHITITKAFMSGTTTTQATTASLSTRRAPGGSASPFATTAITRR
jgi:predicted amidohydrolase